MQAQVRVQVCSTIVIPAWPKAAFAELEQRLACRANSASYISRGGTCKGPQLARSVKTTWKWRTGKSRSARAPIHLSCARADTSGSAGCARVVGGMFVSARAAHVEVAASAAVRQSSMAVAPSLLQRQRTMASSFARCAARSRRCPAWPPACAGLVTTRSAGLREPLQWALVFLIRPATPARNASSIGCSRGRARLGSRAGLRALQ